MSQSAPSRRRARTRAARPARQEFRLETPRLTVREDVPHCVLTRGAFMRERTALLLLSLSSACVGPTVDLGAAEEPLSGMGAVQDFDHGNDYMGAMLQVCGPDGTALIDPTAGECVPLTDARSPGSGAAVMITPNSSSSPRNTGPICQARPTSERAAGCLGASARISAARSPSTRLPGHTSTVANEWA